MSDVRGERLMVLAALFLGAFVIALDPIADGDIFWHLAAGREMVHRHALLNTDTFTSSASGRPWLDLHWLFQLGSFAVNRTAGLAGLVIAKAFLVATGSVILARAVSRSATPSKVVASAGSNGSFEVACCAIGLLGALFLSRHLLLARPVIVTLVMLALFLAGLEASRSGTRRALRWLPVLQVVWVNCQGLAVLGPVLIGIYLVAALAAPRGALWPFHEEGALSRRGLAITLGLCCLGLLANPHGLRAVGLSGTLFLRLLPRAGNVFSSQIAENVPPWLLQRSAPAGISHFAWYLGAFGACLVLSRERLTLSRLLIVMVFAGLALVANRNVLLFYWIATPIAADAIAPRIRSALGHLVGPLLLVGSRLGRRWIDRRSGRTDDASWTRRVELVPALAVLAGQITLAGVAHSRESSIAFPVPFHFPVESSRYLVRQGASGSIFAPDHHGGYLELNAPAMRPFIDTRLILHTADEYLAYLQAVADPAKFDALAAAQDFRYVVLTTMYPDRYLGLAQHLASSEAWHLVFTDGSEILFARQGRSLDLSQRATTKAILGDLAARFAGSAPLEQAARLAFARLLIVLHEPREAQTVLATLNSRAATQMRARAHLVAGEREAAESLARILVDADGRDVRSLTLLAQIALERGRIADGAEWLRRALGVDPYDSEARAVLETMEQSERRSQLGPAVN